MRNATENEEDGMSRMSFLEHLEELRTCIIRSLAGVAVAMALSFTFTGPLWDFVQGPGRAALLQNGARPELFAADPVDPVNIIWFKLPLICALFLASPWIVYQAWRFIAPGLYRSERRWAAPFLLAAGSFFIAGGLFGYFVVFATALDSCWESARRTGWRRSLP